nr:14 kDa proline-rich protein DC2.15-like [Ipomoea trifida]
MASKAQASAAAFFLSFNLFFFAFTTGAGLCPIDGSKLGVCANSLGGLVGAVVGTPPTGQCCSLFAGLADLDAAVCLCTAITPNVLGTNLNIPLALSLVLNDCGRQVPNGFTC